MKLHRWSPEEQEFMAQFVPGHHHREIVAEHNRRFDYQVTESQTAAFIKNHHLQTGFTGHYEKGHISPTKGIPLSPEQREKVMRTAFQKGNRPHNALPVGSEVISSEGYVRIKVAEPRKWKFRTHMAWEAANGPRPEGYAIIHINGIKTDDRIENLTCVPYKVLARINQSGLMREGNEENNRTVIALATMQAAIGDAKRRGK